MNTATRVKPRQAGQRTQPGKSAGQASAKSRPAKRASNPLLASRVIAALSDLADPKIAEHSSRFFKTGKGEYAHGDVFIGVRVPDVRKLARRFDGLSVAENQKLLRSRVHEVRLCALIMLVNRFAAARGDKAGQRRIYQLYMANTRYINNWDLVDCSAYQIVGGWLLERSHAPLYRLVRSRSLWERRIAMMSTWLFIREGQFDDTFRLAEILLDDPQDLIHKVTGWMLREVAKRDRSAVTDFLTTHYDRFPRTALRYAIERYPVTQRRRLLAGHT